MVMLERVLSQQSCFKNENQIDVLLFNFSARRIEEE
jgi:hypothetical protein